LRASGLRGTSGSRAEGWTRFSGCLGGRVLSFVPVFLRRKPVDCLVVVLVALSAFFFSRMVRLNVLFSVFVSLCTGLFFAWLLGLDYSYTVYAGGKKRRRKKKVVDYGQYARVVVVAFVVVLAVYSVKSGLSFASHYPLGLGSDWFEALDWLKNNSAPGDVVWSWWDYGYWIQVYAERPTLADGATVNSSQIRRLARGFVLDESEARRLCLDFNVTWVVVDVFQDVGVGRGGVTFQGKWTAMAYIARQNVADYLTRAGNVLVLTDRGKSCTIFRLGSPVYSQSPALMESFRLAHVSPHGQVVIYRFTG